MSVVLSTRISYLRRQAEASYDGLVHAAVSQPLLGLPTLEEFAKLQPIGQRITDHICLSRELAPPTAGIYIGDRTLVVRNSDGDTIMDKAKEVIRFMRRCLRLDSADRENAKELLQDEWFDDTA
ncbi:hypothetical protein EDD18DRAFT_1337250 [Armillaria luteobubalina]|uniref:Uncharacterized protein n=1 Tax=Armillaria luteobubalina TaxID=153913 RepID=A0AA39UB22_9AGAR|nr:hypothetical protein EDD18DRAFT_1337250 [Armillaria luteobubalina]